MSDRPFESWWVQVGSDLSENIVNSLVVAGKTRQAANKMATACISSDPYDDRRMAPTIAWWLSEGLVESAEEHAADLHRFKTLRRQIKNMRLNVKDDKKTVQKAEQLLGFEITGVRPEAIGEWIRDAMVLSGDDMFDDSGLERVAEKDIGPERYVVYAVKSRQDCDVPLMKRITYCITSGYSGYGGFPFYIVTRQRPGLRPEQFAAILPKYTSCPRQSIRNATNSNRLDPDDVNRIADLIKAAYKHCDAHTPASAAPVKKKTRKMPAIIVPKESLPIVYDPDVIKQILRKEAPSEDDIAWLECNVDGMSVSTVERIVERWPTEEMLNVMEFPLSRSPRSALKLAETVGDHPILRRCVRGSVTAAELYAEKYGFDDEMLSLSGRLIRLAIMKKAVPTTTAGLDAIARAYITGVTNSQMIDYLESLDEGVFGALVRRAFATNGSTIRNVLCRNMEATQEMLRRKNYKYSSKMVVRSSPQKALTEAIYVCCVNGQPSREQEMLVLANPGRVAERLIELARQGSALRLTPEMVRQEEILSILPDLHRQCGAFCAPFSISQASLPLVLERYFGTAAIAKIDRSMKLVGIITHKTAEEITRVIPEHAETFLRGVRYLPLYLPERLKNYVSFEEAEVIEFPEEIAKAIAENNDRVLHLQWANASVIRELRKHGVGEDRIAAAIKAASFDMDIFDEMPSSVEIVLDIMERSLRDKKDFEERLFQLADHDHIVKAVSGKLGMLTGQNVPPRIRRIIDELPIGSFTRPLRAALRPEDHRRLINEELERDPLDWNNAREVAQVYGRDHAVAVINGQVDKFGKEAVAKTIALL